MRVLSVLGGTPHEALERRAAVVARTTRGLGLALALVLWLSSASAKAQVPMGPTFTVNTYTTSTQNMARVASRGNGDFVFVWCDRLADYTGFALRGRILPASGAAGPEFQVNSSTSSEVCRVSVWFERGAVAAADTGFVVAWSADIAGRRTVLGRRFDWDGQGLGAEFQVNSTPADAEHPAVAMTPQGAFMVVWSQLTGTGAEIRAQRFDAQGGRIGGEFEVQSATTFGGTNPTVASGSDGRMVVAWERVLGSLQLVARLFDPTGGPVGEDVPLSLPGLGAWGPSLAILDDGRFMAAWEGDSPRGPRARAFDAAGNPLAGEIVLSQAPVSATRLPSVAPYGRERYVVTWHDGGNPLTPMPVRLFDGDGSPHGTQFVVTGTPDYYGPQWPLPEVASDAVGNMTFAWARLVRFDYAPFIDTMGRRFYGGVIPQPAAIDPAAGPTSDGNGVLEACETVAMRPRWRNDTGATQTLSGTLASFTGPPGASYTILDGAADYGTLADGAAASCAADCYTVGVSCASPRPAAHWDAALLEDLAPVPQRGRWAMHVGDSFQDVPRASPFYRFVEALIHHAVTAGCAPSRYCPSSPVTREQMAVFVLAAKEEEDFRPNPCFGLSPFVDVSPTSPTCPFMKAVFVRGIAGGCAADRYCPSDSVTREQMAVFVLRTLDPELSPPACTAPMFADVPASSPFCRWVEELARRGVVTGCGGGNYCPAAPVTREQMAVFLGVSFGLSLYGP